jgi:predicted aconitase
MKNWISAVAAAAMVSGAIGLAQSQPATPEAPAMMANHQKMMSAMQAADKKLTDLVAQMNAARGEDRLDKVIAVVNELASAHRQMGDMMSRHHGMMHGMTNAPAADSKPSEDHSSHHPEKK